MRTYDRTTEILKFWKLYKEILTENGEPFKIYKTFPDETKHHRSVSFKYDKDSRILLEFLVSKKVFRVGLYLSDIPKYNLMLKHEAEIKKSVSFPIAFREGEKNKDIKRVFYEFDIVIGNSENYRDIIEQSLFLVKELRAIEIKY